MGYVTFDLAKKPDFNFQIKFTNISITDILAGRAAVDSQYNNIDRLISNTSKNVLEQNRQVTK